jgi:hypothetical protein
MLLLISSPSFLDLDRAVTGKRDSVHVSNVLLVIR